MQINSEFSNIRSENLVYVALKKKKKKEKRKERNMKRKTTLEYQKAQNQQCAKGQEKDNFVKNK